MIQLSSAVSSLMNQAVVESFWCVSLGDEHYTTFYTDLQIGAKTYLSNGAIAAIDPPRMDSVVDRQPFEITLSDVTFEKGQDIEQGIVGRPVTVYLGLVDQATQQPLIGDMIVVYKGRIDGASYAISTSSVGDSLLKLVCSSPMHNLDLIRAYYTSQDYSDKNHPGDTSYEQIYEGAGPINLKWGKD